MWHTLKLLHSLIYDSSQIINILKTDFYIFYFPLPYIVLFKEYTINIEQCSG